MKRYTIPALIAVACLCLIVGANVARGQVVYGNRTYTAPVCNRPNCAMCNAIRAGLASQRQSAYSYQWSYQWQCNNGQCAQVMRPIVTTSRVVTTTSKASQASSTAKQRAALLAALNLTPDDRLADIGCGDGGVLIAAVERYGCTAVGIEIDPEKAAEARRNVLKAIADHRIPGGSIEIITGDAGAVTPAGIDAAVVYLWPDTLEELRPVLRRIPRVASLMHPIPGLEYVRKDDDVYVYRNIPPPSERVQDAPSTAAGTQAVGGIQIFN